MKKNKDVKIMRKSLLVSCVFAFIFAGCAMKKDPNDIVINQAVIKNAQKIDEARIKQFIEDERKSNIYDSEFKTFTAVGEGIAPVNTVSKAQAVVLAKKAAIADAYKRLGEKLFGVRITSSETVKDAMLQNSRIVSKVNGLIKDASIVNEKYENGIYKIKLELRITKSTWSKIFSY
jgi:hypothetical protein